MGNRLKGRNAVVTGAGRGIGKAVALALAEEGANVVVCDYGGKTDGTGGDQSPADEVVAACQKFGVKAVSNYGNVASFKAAEEMVKACVSNFGRIDILCNIAGIDKPKMLFNMSEEEWDQVIAVHLKGTFNLTRHALPLMREQRFGRIINTVSDAFLAGPGHVNYSAAKGGIASLTYGVAAEMGRYGITCNAFIPRARTRMVMDDAVIEGLKKRVTSGVWTQEQYDQKMRELADPEYFATFLAYLASDAAANINGCLFLTTGNNIGYWSKPEVIAQIDRNWEKDGRWPVDELAKLVPEKLLTKYVNPAPPQPEKK